MQLWRAVMQTLRVTVVALISNQMLLKILKHIKVTYAEAKVPKTTGYYFIRLILITIGPLTTSFP